MRRKLAVIVLFVYSIVTCMAMAQTVAPGYYFNHETRTTKAGQVKLFHIKHMLPAGFDNDKAAADLANYLLSLNHSNQYQSQYKLISQQS